MNIANNLRFSTKVIARIWGSAIFTRTAAHLIVGPHADDAMLSLAAQGASVHPKPVLFLGTRAFVYGDVDNCLERSAP